MVSPRSVGARSAPSLALGRGADIDTVAAVAVAVLTAVAFLLRDSQIHQALQADELFTYDDLHGRGLVAVLRTVHTGGENSPPLYFVLAWLSAKLGDAAVWIRLPSLVLGTATVPLVYAVGRETVGRAAALVGASIVAVGPFAVYYGVEARPYATMVFFVVLSTLALLRAVRTGAWGWWLLYAAAAAAAAYSHYTSVFVLAVLAAWSLWLGRDRLRAPILANTLIFVLYIPWLPRLRGKQLEVIGALHPLTFHNVVDDASRAIIGSPGVAVHRIPGEIGSVAIAACAIVGAMLLATRWWRLPRRVRRTTPLWRPAIIGTLALASPIGLLLYSALVTDLFLPRGLIASLPAAALVLGALTTAPPRWWAVLTTAAVLGFFVAGTVESFDRAYRRDAINDVARFIDKRAGPNTAVVYIPVAGFVVGRTAPFAEDIKIYLHRHEALRSLPSPQQLAGIWRTYPRVFVVAPRLQAPIAFTPPAPPPSQRRPRLATARLEGINTYVVTEYGPPAASPRP